ncbi:triose-phosphate isomerase family protein [Patescibacteria group bacterium]
MKKQYIIGNWKSNVTVEEAKAWMESFAPAFKQLQNKLHETTVIISVPFTDLYPLKELINEHSIQLSLGAQDVSPFPEGAYTGEVTAQMIKELADWVIIGHSERRSLLKEGDEELSFEVMQAKTHDVSVVYCVPDEKTHIPGNVDIVGYEPTWAIGTGKTDTPENANSVTKKIDVSSGINEIVYGGSVTSKNVKEFLQQDYISGVLVGGASLDPQKFIDLIKQATS